MKYPTRRYFTQSDKTLMWDRWLKTSDKEHETAAHKFILSPQAVVVSR